MKPPTETKEKSRPKKRLKPKATENVYLRLTVSERTRLEVFAFKHEKNMSDILREYIRTLPEPTEEEKRLLEEERERVEE